MTELEVRTGEGWACGDCHAISMTSLGEVVCSECQRSPKGWYRRFFYRVGEPAADIYVATDPDYGFVQWY